MNYYFTGSTKNLKADDVIYKAIFEGMSELSCTASNYVHLSANNPLRLKYEKQLAKNELSVYELQTMLIDKSDFMIAEVTRESITVGYQIDYAIRRKIPVLVLVKSESEHPLPVMLTDDHFGLLKVEKYSNTDKIKEILSNFVKMLVVDRIKFNFFINIPIHTYITKRAEQESKSKSELIREIITREIARHPLE